MSKPHIHAEVIKAWADGKQIQVRYSPEGEWLLYAPTLWFTSNEYRVKPETLKYRVALFRNSDNVWTGDTSSAFVAENWSQTEYFVRWLTDWIEVEI